MYLGADGEPLQLQLNLYVMRYVRPLIALSHDGCR
jgi:hypothetical protein